MIVYCTPNGSIFQRWDTDTGEAVTLTANSPALTALAGSVWGFKSASLAANGEVWVSLYGSFGDDQVFAILDPATLAPRLVRRIRKGDQQGTTRGYTRPEFAGFVPVDGKNWTVYTQQGGV